MFWLLRNRFSGRARKLWVNPLGTNALIGLGFRVIHVSGMEVCPQYYNGEAQSFVSRASVLQVTL